MQNRMRSLLGSLFITSTLSFTRLNPFRVIIVYQLIKKTTMSLRIGILGHTDILTDGFFCHLFTIQSPRCSRLFLRKSRRNVRHDSNSMFLNSIRYDQYMRLFIWKDSYSEERVNIISWIAMVTL